MIWILLFLVVLVLFTRFYLDGSNLAAFDLPPGQSFHSDREPGEEYDAVVASLMEAPRRQSERVQQHLAASSGAAWPKP